jgi:hypothetical protein
MSKTLIPKAPTSKSNPFTHFIKGTTPAPNPTILNDTLASETVSKSSSVRKKRKYPNVNHPVTLVDSISSAENSFPFPPKEKKRHCKDHAMSEFPAQLPHFDVLVRRTDSQGRAASSPPVTQQSQVCNGFLSEHQILSLELFKSHSDLKVPKDQIVSSHPMFLVPKVPSSSSGLSECESSPSIDPALESIPPLALSCKSALVNFTFTPAGPSRKMAASVFL